jgi:hypothetical protein
MRALLTLGLVCTAGPAWAHGIGNRYDLPLPLGMFATGGALAVLLSFVVAAWFLRQSPVPIHALQSGRFLRRSPRRSVSSRCSGFCSSWWPALLERQTRFAT